MIDVILFLVPFAFVAALFGSYIEAQMECYELRTEVEVKDAEIAQLKKENNKLKFRVMKGK